VLSWKGSAIQGGLQPGGRGIAIVKSRYQATTSEDTVGWKRLSVCSSDLYSVEISDDALIQGNYELCVKVVNKSNTKPKPRRESHIYVTICPIQNGILSIQILFILHS
jgi:hypothetical protein